MKREVVVIVVEVVIAVNHEGPCRGELFYTFLIRVLKIVLFQGF